MWIYRNVFGRFNEIEGLGDHFKFIQLERNYFTESLCQCTLNVYWLLIIFINVTYITENDKLFHYNTKGKQDRSSLLPKAAKVMPERLIQWDR